MSTLSIFETLRERGAILEVPKNAVHTLKTHDKPRAIGARELDRGACLVLVGTTSGSAIAMAHIDASHAGSHLQGITADTAGSRQLALAREMHYMELFRKALHGFLREPELFQMPLAWVIFGQHEDDTAFKNLQERTSNIFKHLNVRLSVLSCGRKSAASTHPQRGKGSVVAVRHGDEATEIYIGDDLSAEHPWFPKHEQTFADQKIRHAGSQEETRQDALHRENEALKSELQELQDFVEYLKCAPESNALASIKQQTCVNDIGSTVVVATSSQQSTTSIHGTPFDSNLLNPARSNLQTELSAQYSKVYPSIPAFQNPLNLTIPGTSPDDPPAPAAHQLCDPRLQDLDITFWSNVPVSNSFAAAAISQYMQMEHPAIAIFDAGLFIGDLVDRRNDYCSRLLVNALLSYAMQAYIVLDSGAQTLHARFFAEAKGLWLVELYPDTLINLAALTLMGFAGAVGGLDLDGRYFDSCAIDLAAKLGLRSWHFYPDLLSTFGEAGEVLRFQAHIAWGYFVSGWCGLLCSSLLLLVCKLWMIAEEALANEDGDDTLGQLSLEIVESTYRKLLEWAADLPGSCARMDISPHHVIVMHAITTQSSQHLLPLHHHLPPPPLDRKPPHPARLTIDPHHPHLNPPRLPLATQTNPHPAPTTLRRVTLPRHQHPRHNLHLARSPDQQNRRQRMALLLPPLPAIAPPISERQPLRDTLPQSSAILTIAIAESKISFAKARELLEQLQGLKGARNSRSYLELELGKLKGGQDESGNVERLAGEFERVVLGREVACALEEWEGLESD
ncbi:hypothetical protein Q7P37_002426 [Cladosporium fusiforme]